MFAWIRVTKYSQAEVISPVSTDYIYRERAIRHARIYNVTVGCINIDW